MLLVSIVLMATVMEAQPQLLGGDLDEHGCKASAGYMWCEAHQRCLRPWLAEWIGCE